jgi:hypothetical protein
MKRKQTVLLYVGLLCSCYIHAQQPVPKTLPAKRTVSSFKIDGNLDEAAWKEAIPATKFVEWRPNFGAIEEDATRTEIYLLYDNTSIYIGGYCHEKSKDSVSKELVGRDQIGVNDYVGVIFDTYHDKINGFGFYMTPLGEQYDAKYSNTIGEDDSWNAVWDGEAKLVSDGWTFEMRIPYSAIRFVSKDNQTWGLNITRNRKKVGRQFMWNPVDPKVNGFVNQEGQWTGIEKIEAPLRLQFSPYFSTYFNHVKKNDKYTKDLTASVNGGMDVKYGISDAFTLDMTLIPDFGQVQSDNQVLNLSPFEIKFNENRPFFTEGTELFSKGNLFYSRRIGSQPIHFYDVQDTTGWYPGHIEAGERFLKNPKESKLINATKVSGRTKKGFGLGVFNAVTKPMYATLVNISSKDEREVRTGPLTNYNIIVFDQTLKNNSSVSFINTNTWRSGDYHDANVSAAVFDFNNKKNVYGVNGKFALSQLMSKGNNITGYSHNIVFRKYGGNWNFELGEELADNKYDINDLGILFNSNFMDHFLWTAYRWQKPKNWYRRIQLNYNFYHSSLFTKVPGQLINTKFQSFNTNVNANIQMNNLWWAGMFVGFNAKGYDFYEPRITGYAFRTPQRLQFNPWFETNFTKKYYATFNYFVGFRKYELFNSPNHEFYLQHRYRFSSKVSVTHDLTFNPVKNDAGFYTYHQHNVPGDPVFNEIIFSRRNRKTVENVVSFKFSFNNKASITVRTRHYWSKVDIKQLYDLQADGSLRPTIHNDLDTVHRNYNIFNVDAVYSWQFAPGSFINVVWKDQSYTEDGNVQYQYFKNFRRTIGASPNNSLSFKIIYFLDYLDFKKWRKKKT